MEKVTTVDNMRKSDAATIANGISGRELMYRAAMGIFSQQQWSGKSAILTGGGNNGGDGFALAYILYKNGYQCDIYMVKEKFTADSLYYYEKCKQNNIEIFAFDNQTKLNNYQRVVDCIFGTGFKGKPQELAEKAIKEINRSKYVICADINSGLNGDNGKAELAVKSDVTISVGCYKTGHFLNDAKDYIKALKNVDIGIQLVEDPFYLIENTDLKDVFIKRKSNSHKGVYGKVLLIGGCVMYSGAIKLTAMSNAALRMGAGLATVAVPASIAQSLLPYMLEATLYPLPEKNGFIKYDKLALKKAMTGVKSVAMGMGLGKGEDNYKIIKFIVENFDIPIVIDADGLNALQSQNLEFLKGKKVIITPHVKEFSRISGIDINYVIDNPVYHAKQFAAKYGIIVLLKGSSTIVTDGHEVYLTNTGTPGMAKGGSGDVLSGIIAGINAFSNQSFLMNVACAAYINGKAAEYAVQEKNEYSVVASDTINNIYKAINFIISEG